MTNELQVRANISFVMKERGLNPRSLSNGDDNLWKKIYNQFTKGKTLTLDTIITLLNAVPDLNTEWLFHGIGSPFKDMQSTEERIAQLENRLSALEGERENVHSDASHTA